MVVAVTVTVETAVPGAMIVAVTSDSSSDTTEDNSPVNPHSTDQCLTPPPHTHTHTCRT